MKGYRDQAGDVSVNACLPIEDEYVYAVIVSRSIDRLRGLSTKWIVASQLYG